MSPSLCNQDTYSEEGDEMIKQEFCAHDDTVSLIQVHALSSTQAAALRIVRELVAESFDVGGEDMPPDCSWVMLDEVMAQVMAAIPVEQGGNKKQAHAALNWLVKNGYIDCIWDKVVLVYPD